MIQMPACSGMGFVWELTFLVFEVGLDEFLFLKEAAIYKVTTLRQAKKRPLRWELSIVEISQKILEFEVGKQPPVRGG